MYTTPNSAFCKPIIPRFLKKTRIFDRRNRPQTGRGGLGEESLQFVHAFFARADGIDCHISCDAAQPKHILVLKP